MKCPKCQNELQAQSRFCSFCGAQLEPVRQPVEQLHYQQPAAPQPQFQQPVYQQPTYAQQVYQDRQKAMAHTASPGKKKLPVLMIVIAAAVLLVCAAALVLGLVFSSRTVYLVSEQVTENQTSVTTYSYAYTDDGKLAFYQMEIEYKSDYSYMEDICNSVSYSYDKKSNLESVEFEVNGESYEYEYVYNKDGSLKALEGEDQEFEIKCDEKGRITSVKSADDDSFSGKYSYHDNGILKKITVTSGSAEMEYRYNEQGRLLSEEVKYNGSKTYYTENTYDKDGNILENVVEAYSGGVLAQTTTTTYAYEAGLPVSYEIEISLDDASVALLFETGDEGPERIFDLVEVKTEGEDMDQIAEELEASMDGVSIEMVYDEQGNLLELDMNLTDMGFVSNQAYSYVAVKVPKNYAMIYLDPIYFQSIDPSHRTSGSYPAAADTPAQMPAATEAATEPPVDAPAAP